MTDRLKGCVVTFDQDIREDDAKPLIDAILQLKGVISVCTDVADISDHINRERIRHDLIAKLYEALERKP